MKRSCPSYDTLSDALRPLVPQASEPQRHNLALFVYGLLLTWHVHLPKIALCLPIPGTVDNALQRLERFVQNKAIAPTTWYQGVVRFLFAACPSTEVELIMDQTSVGDRFHLLVVALAYRNRALPILWRVLPHEGASGVQEQTKLLRQVAKLVPSERRVVLYADREYGSVGLFRFLHQQGWFFVIRMKRDVWCKMACGRHFQLHEIPLAPGQVNFEDAVFLPALPDVRLSLNCGWSSRDAKDEAWYLLTNLPVGKAILARYSRRFWIEEMFRDFKEQGFRLEKTHLKAEKRFSVLLLCVCIAYTWALLLAEQLEKAGKRREIDRPNKPQLSLFQFLLRYLRRLLARGEPFPKYLCLST